YRCDLALIGYVHLPREAYSPSRGTFVRATSISTGARAPFGVPFGSEIADYAGYMPVAPGAPLSLSTAREEISIDVMGELNLHGACECGCGGDYDSGTAACDPH